MSEVKRGEVRQKIVSRLGAPRQPKAHLEKIPATKKTLKMRTSAFTQQNGMREKTVL